MNPEAALATYDRTGAAIVAGLVGAAAVAELRDEFGRLADAAAGSARKGAVYGIRGLLKKSAPVARLASQGALIGLARQLIGSAARPVRGMRRVRNGRWSVWGPAECCPKMGHIRIIPYFQYLRYMSACGQGCVSRSSALSSRSRTDLGIFFHKTPEAYWPLPAGVAWLEAA